MNLSTMVNILNEKYGTEGIRYHGIYNWRPKSKELYNCEVEFQVGQRLYKANWHTAFVPPNCQCKQKREWAPEMKKADEWIESEFTRDLIFFLDSLHFDDDGELIVDLPITSQPLHRLEQTPVNHDAGTVQPIV